MKKAQAYWPLILLMAIIKFTLPLFLQDASFELQRDEYLYYEQGHHLAFGYLENPPMIGWLASISSLFGGSVAWIKFWPCLFGAATVVVTCLITAELGGNLFAQFLAALGIITGAYLRVHFLFQPNILDIFFWTLSIYFVVCYINTRQTQFIYWLALSLCLGFYSKYSILLFGIALVLSILLTRERKLLIKKETLIALLASLVIILPNIIWQYNHNWPLLHHMKELKETQLTYISPSDFLKDQVLMLFPVLIVWVAGLIWLLRQPAYRLIAFTWIAVIILLLATNGKNYYSLGAYPMLLAAGGVCLERLIKKRVWAQIALTIFIIVLSLPLVPLLLPVWPAPKLAAFYARNNIGATGILKWEDQQEHELPQDFADMTGWKELANKTADFYGQLTPAIKDQTIIFAENYGQAGALHFYGPDREFRNKVYTTNGSFLLWIPDNLEMKNLILIDHDIPGKDEELYQHFKSITVVDSVTNPFSRQYGDKIMFLQELDGKGLSMARELIESRKSIFRRKQN